MTQPTIDPLELHIELFGWQVVAVHEDVGPLPGTDGDEHIAALWEIASRWSPPDARMAILFVATGDRVRALEAAVVVGERTVVRLHDAELFELGPDGFDDPRLETFAANLGRYRGQPVSRSATVGHRRSA